MNSLVEEIQAAIWSVWNRRWLALAIAWGICVLGWLAVALFPNTYESHARIFVQLDDALAQQIGIGAATREKDIERVRQTLTSAVNLEKVIRSTSIGKGITTTRQMEGAVASLAEDIKVKSQQENLFEITATSGRSDLSDGANARLAQDITQRMIDIFREENLGGSRGEMRETIDFLDTQLADRQRQLEEAEQRRLAFEAEHPELIGGAQAVAARLAGMRSELRSVEADLAAAQSSFAAIEGQLAGTPQYMTGPGASGPQAALAQARSNLAAMKARGLTDSHPDVMAATAQIESLRAQAENAGTSAGTPNPAYTSLLSIRGEREANVQSLRSRAAALQSEIASVVASQVQEPGVAAEAQRISRDYEVLRQQYDKLLQDREELKLRGQVETERSAIKFEIVDPPTMPRVPAAPNRPLLLFGVLFVGLCGGAGGAWALGKLKSTFATTGQLERGFALPVLGSISLVLNEQAKALRRKRLRQFAAATGGLFGVFVILIAAEFIQRGMVA